MLYVMTDEKKQNLNFFKVGYVLSVSTYEIRVLFIDNTVLFQRQSLFYSVPYSLNANITFQRIQDKEN